MNLFCRKLGQGEAIIILHGLYGSSDNWMSIAKVLSQNYTVYLPDMRNHGKSPHSDIHNYEVMANDVFEFMDSVLLDRAIIIGHSMGGKTAINFANKHPEKVSRLIVVDISPKSYLNKPEYNVYLKFHKNIMESLIDLSLEEYKTRDELFVALRKKIPDVHVRHFLLKNIKRDPKKGFYWQLNLNVLNQNLIGLMDGISIENYKGDSLSELPVLFIKGEDSGYIKEDDFEHLNTLFPLSNIVTISNAGHWVHAEQPERFIEVLLRFLEK